MPIDASIPLGAKAPDQMQSLSSMLGVAQGAQNLKIGAQTLQQNQQATQQGGIDLKERQAVSQVLSDPSSYTDQDGNIDFTRAMPKIMQVAPTTGVKYVQGLMTAQKQHSDAQQSLNNLTTDVRQQTGKVLYAMPPDTAPDVFNGAVDALSKQYKGGEKYFNTLKQGYSQAVQMGKGADFIANAAKTTIGQPEQQQMNTPTVATVDNNQQRYGVNIKPGVPGMPLGAEVPGTRTQMQLPPTTPTVGTNNQPGYVGPQPPVAAQPPIAQPQGAGPAAQPGVNGSFHGNPADAQMAISQIGDPQERANAQAAFEAQMRATGGQLPPHGFVPSGPVPGANESKGGTVQVMNDHWARINAGAADAPVANALLTTIKQLAPNAITGAEAGKRAYWNGLFNVLIPGTQASGDLQKDTDLLNKAMAQLNLSTPATTDAMRTLIEAGRPHSTMSAGAINDAVGQIQGQLKANMAMRNMLSTDKQYADSTGDPTHYTQKRQSLEGIADPRIFQYASMPKGKERTDFINRQPDAADLRKKAAVLDKMGAFQ